MTNHLDLLVVGAGPAGLAAAVSARSCGLDVAVVDEQAHVGGQLFRNLHTVYGRHVLDNHDKEIGLNLIEKFEKSNAQFFPQTSVWGLYKDEVSCQYKGEPQKISASKILFAVGGMERAVPFTGWTLPGVITAGAAEILMRSGGSVSPNNEPVVLAGNGPLLMALAVHLIEAGVPIAAWLDTGTFAPKFQSAMYMTRIYQDLGYLKRGMGMALTILKKRVKIITGVTQIEALGSDHINAVRYQKGGAWHTIQTSRLIRHENIVPRTQVPSALGIDLAWDKVQRYWHPVTDAYGRTNLNNVYMTGDAAFVNGGEAAVAKGYVSGIAIANDLGAIANSEAIVRQAEHLKRMNTLVKARDYLRYVFAPNPAIYNVPDDTIVCRCESVTAKEIRNAISEGYHTPDEVKRFTRAGMGPCQGRMCASALGEIIAQEQGIKIETIPPHRNRQPFAPVSLGDYCKLHAPK